MRQGIVREGVQRTLTLKEHFGDGRPLDSITNFNAKAWRESLTKKDGTPIAENTARKITAVVKALFTAAVEDDKIGRNPFAGLPTTTQKNRSRDFFLSEDSSRKILAACPDSEWRLIFGLAR